MRQYQLNVGKNQRGRPSNFTLAHDRMSSEGSVMEMGLNLPKDQ
mgnify:CR=1 FL=1